MRCSFSWQLSSLLFIALAATALDNSSQSGQSPSNPPADSATPPGTDAVTTPPATSTPSLTVTGKLPPIPKLAPDKFTACYAANNVNGGSSALGHDGEAGINWPGMVNCEAELARDTRIVIDKCTNRDGKSAPPVAIQACTELLDGAGWEPGSGSKLLEGHDR